MLSVSQADIARMRAELLFDGPEAGRKLSRFWILLVLAAMIASAGIVADSTATVIGAMIVAPLMTPILGTVFSVITGDHANALRSATLVVGGSLLVIAVGWLFALLVPIDVAASTSSQVAGRVQPRLIDLVAALATGAVGAFALVRSDVSDTLPGVAIAISLVPPLAVVGATLEAGAAAEARGALLLFLTNVGAILLSGFLVMTLYRVYRSFPGSETARSRQRAVATVLVFVALLGVELAVSSARITTTAIERSDVAATAEAWATAGGWTVESVETTPNGVEVKATGPLPAPDPEQLRSDLDSAGLASTDVVVELTPSQRVELDGS